MFSPGLLGQTGPGGTQDWGTLGMGYTGPTGDRGDTGPRGDTVSHSCFTMKCNHYSVSVLYTQCIVAYCICLVFLGSSHPFRDDPLTILPK